MLGDLTPRFDANAFDKLSLVEKINTLSTVFFNCGCVVGHFDVTADTRDSGKAILTINLERVLSRITARSGDLDFSQIGLTSHPLPETLPFFETTTVIVEAPGSPPLSPLSALTIDLKKKVWTRSPSRRRGTVPSWLRRITTRIARPRCPFFLNRLGAWKARLAHWRREKDVHPSTIDRRRGAPPSPAQRDGSRLRFRAQRRHLSGACYDRA